MAKKKEQTSELEVDTQQEAIDAAYQKMSGSQRAAVVMLLLGEDQASTIVQFLSLIHI